MLSCLLFWVNHSSSTIDKICPRYCPPERRLVLSLLLDHSCTLILGLWRSQMSQYWWMLGWRKAWDSYCNNHGMDVRCIPVGDIYTFLCILKRYWSSGVVDALPWPFAICAFLFIKPILKQKVVGLHCRVMKPSQHVHVDCLIKYMYC